MDGSLHFLIVLASAPLVLSSHPNATYLGCFMINRVNMPERKEATIDDMVSSCIDHCYDEGYQYAALKRTSEECGCGRDIPFVSEKLNDSSCIIKCPGNHSLTCGSYLFHSVYEIHNFHTIIDVDKMEGFLFGYLNGVDFINLTDPDETRTILRTTERVKHVDFHWKKQMVFAFTTDKKYSSDFSGNATARRLLGVPSTSCEAFAVDWVRDRLLWADCQSRASIKSSDLNGTNEAALIDRNVNSPITRMEVDPIAGKIFWMLGKTIESCSIDGTNLQMNLTRTSFTLRGLALDLPSKRVFFLGLNPNNGSAVLYSMGYSGDQLTTHWGLEQMKTIYGLSVFRGVVYWTNYEGRDVMFEAPLNDSNAVRKIGAVNKSVWHIRLVHPDLQPQPSEDPCAALQCSYRCDGSRCVCPEDRHLAPDLRTCRGNNESLANLTFVGCFGAISESAIGESSIHLANTTLGKCADQCRAHNTRYVAVDISSSMCHCGPDIPYESNKFDDVMCDSPCPDNATASCGGDGVHSVYDFIDAKLTDFKNDVCMLVGSSNGVLIFNTSRKFDYGTLRRSIFHIEGVDYHWDKKLAFSLDTRGKMYSSPLNWTTGNQVNNSSVQIHSLVTCDGFAVDWVHDKIFWANCGYYESDYEEESRHVVSIRTINLEGKDEKTVVTQNIKNKVKRMAVDPYAGKLFWIAGGSRSEAVVTCDLDGNNIDTIYYNNATIRDIFLDLASRRVFFVAETGRLALSSMDYSGGDRKDHWQKVDELRFVYGLGVVKGVVYWVNWLVMSSDVLYQAPLGDPSKLEVVRAVMGVWHMRVVHPSLQSDPCAVPECKTGCEPQSAACLCPKHCKIASEALVAPVVESVFLGALLLAATFSVAVLLLYFSDKYWTLIRSRISRTFMPPNRQSRDSLPDGRVSEDNMNLVDD